MDTKCQNFKSFDGAIRAALDWLRSQGVGLEEAFEAKFGGFGMRSLDGSGGYRIEFDARRKAHINVWCHRQRGPHLCFPGNEFAVRSVFRQLFYWDPKLKRRSDEDSNV